MARQTVSCAIVVFNEEQNIQECLDTAKWMDEIVVVDAFSTDRTMEICQQFTHKIFQRPWKGFGEQKNFSIHQATSDWVFILDADERITPELRQEMEAILRSPNPEGPVAYSVPRRNYYYGKWIKHAGCYPDRQLRLFKNGVGQLDDEEPHNKFIFEGPRGDLAEPLEHFTERTINDHFRKFRNFTTLAAQERSRSKRRVYWTDLIVRPLFTFYKYFVARKGFCDGMHGFVVSGFASMYTFVKYVKLYEKFQTFGAPVNQDPPLK
ncbi:MAG: glycosyltransferase family 2 protein [Nitrospirae bacterium]|nr:glycosyltransferase family 2 protein [Nitrospirota bacterium]MDA1303642.1 glycosyltransferase family 2 protein [Nitrospirota bacterium]